MLFMSTPRARICTSLGMLMSFGEAERSYPVASDAREAMFIERLRRDMRALVAYIDDCRAHERLGPNASEALEDAANDLLDQAYLIRCDNCPADA